MLVFQKQQGLPDDYEDFSPWFSVKCRINSLSGQLPAEVGNKTEPAVLNS